MTSDDLRLELAAGVTGPGGILPVYIPPVIFSYPVITTSSTATTPDSSTYTQPLHIHTMSLRIATSTPLIRSFAVRGLATSSVRGKTMTESVKETADKVSARSSYWRAPLPHVFGARKEREPD